ncbi:methyltransferase family protein [Thermodesulfobacteriota bacterium]
MKSKISKILPALLGTLLYLLLLLPFFLIWIPHRILLAPEQIYLFDIGVFRYLGLVPIALGFLIYVLCSRSFVFIGKGTPIPFTPTKELIVTGLYRFVRNPLYIAGVFVLAGEALLFQSIQPGTNIIINLDRPLFQSDQKKFKSIIRWCRKLESEDKAHSDFGIGSKFI